MYVYMPVHVDSPISLKQFLVVCTLKYYGNDIIKCSKHKQFLGTFHSTKISGNSGRRSKRTESFWRLFSKILVNPLVPNFQTFFLFYLTFSLGMTWTYKCSSSRFKCCPDQSLQDGGVTKPIVVPCASSHRMIGSAFLEQWLVTQTDFCGYFLGLHDFSWEKFASFSHHTEIMLELVREISRKC